MRNNWSSSGGDIRYQQSKPATNGLSRTQKYAPAKADNGKKRSSNWSREWNTVKIELEEKEKPKKRKFGSGWGEMETDQAGESDAVDGNLFVFSLNANNNSDEKKEALEFKRKEKSRPRSSHSSSAATITQLPIDPFEVSHCPSWEAKRRLRCKLATTKPCGKHIIFEA